MKTLLALTLAITALVASVPAADEAFAQSLNVALDPNFGALAQNGMIIGTGLLAIIGIAGTIALIVIARGQLFGQEHKG